MPRRSSICAHYFSTNELRSDGLWSFCSTRLSGKRNAAEPAEQWPPLRPPLLVQLIWRSQLLFAYRHLFLNIPLSPFLFSLALIYLILRNIYTLAAAFYTWQSQFCVSAEVANKCMIHGAHFKFFFYRCKVN